MAPQRRQNSATLATARSFVPGGGVGKGPDGGAQHHAVGAVDGAGGVCLDAISEAQLPHAVQCLCGARGRHHLCREIAAFLRDAGDRAANQADADEREAAKKRLRHA
jgi:hypothetical protein